MYVDPRHKTQCAIQFFFVVTSTTDTRKTHARHTPSVSVAHVTRLFPDKAELGSTPVTHPTQHACHAPNATHQIVISILDFKEVVKEVVPHLPHYLTLLNQVESSKCPIP